MDGIHLITLAKGTRGLPLGAPLPNAVGMVEMPAFGE
jgi:hypothetical protein